MVIIMNSAITEVLNFVRENDVKFIKLAFCDLLGVQKNVSLMPDELSRAFTEGVSFDGSSIRGFSQVEKSDLLMLPDPATLNALPWRPQEGRVMHFYCDVKGPRGETFACDSRSILKQAIARCEKMGYSARIGAECEFYLFETDERGVPLRIPQDNGSYFDIPPLDRGESIRREICLCLAEMGIVPETSHHESGPGQNEIDFRYSDVLRAADDLMTFKAMVKSIATRSGLFASFLPKPLAAESGNGLHVNISLSENGKNIFEKSQKSHALAAESFLAGVLCRVREITALLCPIPNSYERLGSFEAPKYISWSHENRSQLVRIPAAFGEKTRIELRSADPTLNPYLGFAAILQAGLDGIEQNMPLPDPVDADLYDPAVNAKTELEQLPASLGEALDVMEQSDFVKRVLGEQAVKRYIEVKRRELEAFDTARDKETLFVREYFQRF